MRAQAQQPSPHSPRLSVSPSLVRAQAQQPSPHLIGTLSHPVQLSGRLRVVVSPVPAACDCWMLHFRWPYDYDTVSSQTMAEYHNYEGLSSWPSGPQPNWTALDLWRVLERYGTPTIIPSLHLPPPPKKNDFLPSPSQRSPLGAPFDGGKKKGGGVWEDQTAKELLPATAHADHQPV